MNKILNKIAQIINPAAEFDDQSEIYIDPNRYRLPDDHEYRESERAIKLSGDSPSATVRFENGAVGKLELPCLVDEIDRRFSQDIRAVAQKHYRNIVQDPVEKTILVKKGREELIKMDYDGNFDVLKKDVQQQYFRAVLNDYVMLLSKRFESRPESIRLNLSPDLPDASKKMLIETLTDGFIKHGIDTNRIRLSDEYRTLMNRHIRETRPEIHVPGSAVRVKQDEFGEMVPAHGPLSDEQKRLFDTGSRLLKFAIDNTAFAVEKVQKGIGEHHDIRIEFDESCRHVTFSNYLKAGREAVTFKLDSLENGKRIFENSAPPAVLSEAYGSVDENYKPKPSGRKRAGYAP